GSGLARDAPRGRRSILQALKMLWHAPGHPNATFSSERSERFQQSWSNPVSRPPRQIIKELPEPFG
ncbi:hypothetical protein, partial [Pseudomonas sp.]|uniref:hypothetical protein n=1 Tax=Pseudomonas sp. TaxID=306 RepID=UPI0028AF8F0D